MASLFLFIKPTSFLIYLSCFHISYLLYNIMLYVLFSLLYILLIFLYFFIIYAIMNYALRITKNYKLTFLKYAIGDNLSNDYKFTMARAGSPKVGLC